MSNVELTIARFENTVKGLYCEMGRQTTASGVMRLDEIREDYLTAIDAMREKAARENPLTLDELKKMDGEPVWIVEWDIKAQSHTGHWELSADADADYFLDREECFYGMTKHDSDKLHPWGWLAYRTRPMNGGTD